MRYVTNYQKCNKACTSSFLVAFGSGNKLVLIGRALANNRLKNKKPQVSIFTAFFASVTSKQTAFSK